VPSFGTPPLSIKNAVCEGQEGAVGTVVVDTPAIDTVTLPPQMVVLVGGAVTSMAQFMRSPFVTSSCGGPFRGASAIEVATFPDTGGDAVGVGDAA
jgi:hypothetical protein